MILGTFADGLRITLQTIFAANKMTADKTIPLENGFIFAETDAAHKLFLENAEINKKYQYISTTKKKRFYLLDAKQREIYSVDYLNGFNEQPLKKIYKEKMNAAASLCDPNINPTFYEDYSMPGYINVYSSPKFTGDILKIFALYEVDDLTSATQELLIPSLYFNTFRNYVIEKIQIMCGVTDQANQNTVQLLAAIEKKLIAEAADCRRKTDFRNPDKSKFVEGSI